MNIQTSYVIHDIRSSKKFKGITICGFKRKDVIKAFENSMINNKLEDAIRWCVELHSTGLNNIIWKSFENIYIKYIHINNPKFLIYYLKRKDIYLKIINKYGKQHEIYTRNNQEIRNLYAELTTICTITKKNNLFLPRSLPIINDKSYQKEDIQNRMISKNLDCINDFIFNSNTSEEKLALNEIINNIKLKEGTYQNIIYWYLWLEKIDKKKVNNIILSNISINNLQNNKYFDYWIMILWKIIMSFEKNLEKNTLIYLKKLYNLYMLNFKISQVKQKKYYIFIAFYLIKNNLTWNTNLFNQEHLIIQTNANINSMYKNIINNIESELSEETKKLLYKKYNELYYKIKSKKIIPEKIINTNLDNNINIVEFTNYPEYNNIKKNNENIIDIKDDNVNSENYKEKLISTNMTERDIINNINEIKNKKLELFTEFITFKKKDEDKKDDKKVIKSVIDYYNIKEEEEEEEFKNILFIKKK